MWVLIIFSLANFLLCEDCLFKIAFLKDYYSMKSIFEKLFFRRFTLQIIDLRFKSKFVKWVMIYPEEIVSNDKIIIMTHPGNVSPPRSPFFLLEVKFFLLEVKFFLLQVKIHLQIKNPHMVHQIIKDFLLEVNLIFNNLVISNFHLLIVMNLFFK
jgi:hypothetical protein